MSSSSKGRPKLGMNRGLAPDLSALRPPADVGRDRSYPALEVVKVAEASHAAERAETAKQEDEPLHDAPSEDTVSDALKTRPTGESTPSSSDDGVDIELGPVDEAASSAAEPTVRSAADSAQAAAEAALSTPAAASAPEAGLGHASDEPTAAHADAEDDDGELGDKAPAQHAVSTRPSAAEDERRPSEIRALAAPKSRPAVKAPATTAAKRPKKPAAAAPAAAAEPEEEPLEAGKRFHGTFTAPYIRKSDGKATRQTTVSFDNQFDERIDSLMRNHRGVFRTKSAAWIAGMEMLLERFGE